MATWQNLVEDSLRKIGRLGSGDSASTLERSDGLAEMTRMIAIWNAEMGLIHFETLDAFTLTGGTASYTIGAGATIAVARPQRILSAQIRRAVSTANVDFEVEVIPYSAYEAIPVKSMQSIPTKIAYQATIASSAGTLHLWPTPNTTDSLRLLSLKPLAIGALGDTVTLPPGYEDALVKGLAVRLAPEYGEQVDPLFMKLAEDAKAILARQNAIVNQREIAAAAPVAKP